MRMWLVFVWFVGVGGGVLASGAAVASGGVLPIASEPGPVELSLVSFNIRYGTANDGENRWEYRREMVSGLLRRLDADVIGVQEALRYQLDEIGEGLTGYVEVGVGRGDGTTRGEYAAILVRADRFSIAECGTFWLSETPSEVASTSWGNRIPRVCTWARLIEKASGRAMYVYNVHMDHQSQASRERGAELIAAKIAERAHAAEPVVVMGDFNAGEDNPAMRYLRGEAERASDAEAWPGHEPAASPGLVDTFRVLHADATEVGTFSGFKLGATTGAKIDHIFVTPEVEVLEAVVDRESEDGRYPSDHFAVIAVVRL